ncbi:hypothetical protein FLONG3_8900 [Fusarium longipes]|uniref:Chromo domain-containing protein n=1 Tax=Fusarium longipes TaxID=694270 RepID=A0A395S230_9HYPO|nr:hypothetical protein FLONG3_8900 [Fusarium longipes]
MGESTSDSDVVMKDSDQESIASTIRTEHDSEDEFNVTAILAEWEVEGSLRYLIEWEGYDLSDATWEPRENLPDELVDEWEKTKANEEIDLYQRIRDWKNAWKAAYAKKRRRHNERNIERMRRGREPHSFERLEELLKWVEGFPDGKESSASAASSPPITDGDSDAGGGQPLRPLSEKRKISGANSSKESSPNASRRSSTPSASKLPLTRVDSTASSHSYTQATRERSNDSSAAVRTSRNKLLPRSGQSRLLKRTDTQSGKLRLTARKTQTAQAFTGNVFAGGKERKRRATLAEAARDPTKTPKFFNSFRKKRIVEKAGHDRDAVAPPKMPSNLISLNPAERNVEAPSIPNPGAGKDHSSTESSVKIPRHDGIFSQAGQKNKPKKSISWGSVEKTTFQEPTEYVREHSLFLRDGTATPEIPWVMKEEWAIDALPAETPPLNPTIQPKTSGSKPNTSLIRGNDYISTDERDSNPLNRTITTSVQFGPGAQGIISVTFERREPQNELPWPAVFENMPTLIFTHTCMVQDFLSQESVLAADKLGNGLVVNNDDGTGLDAVANWLRARSLGALLYRHDLCILVHMQLQPQARAQATTVESPQLHYCLFRPALHFTTRSLAPITLPENLDNERLQPQTTSTVFSRLLGFQYEQLLTEEALAKPPSKHAFFLAFPPNTAQEAQFLCTWLRSCNPKCRILSSFFAGHWQTFLRLEQGVVLIHEEAIWSIRLFPNVNKLLYTSSNFSFFLFSKSLQSSPMYPSLGQPHRIGDVSLQPLGGQKRAALLVTPSFVVSQPQQVWNFFKWFWKAWSDARSHFSVVLCAGFDSWLLEVAAKKETSWLRAPAQETQKARVTKELECLYKTRECVRKIQDMSNEEQAGLILGPEFVDSNDEQSLVNWFGWWSIMNLDRHRRFTVIGSSETDLERFTHCTTRPAFSVTSTSTVVDSQGPERADAPQTALQEKQPAGSESQRRFKTIPDDTSRSFEIFLERLSSDLPRFVTIYPFPVAYWDEGTASRLNVNHDNFKTYSDCLQYFKNQLAHNRFRTAVAVCYTIERKSSHGGLEDARKKRRLWIAVYRPVHLQLSRWYTSELIIWDPVWNRSFRDRAEVYDTDLTEAQQTMIEQLRRDHDMLPLEHIWIGGWETDQSSSVDHVDRTLRHLETLMDDWKNSVPIPNGAMRNRGWMAVQSSPKSPSSEAMDLDYTTEASDTTDEELKIVFHPPRAKQLNGETKCRNKFFLHCKNEELRGSPKDAMEYRFEPTTEWYSHQVEEGRGFEHINFMTWEEIFAKYKIEDPKKVRGT